MVKLSQLPTIPDTPPEPLTIETALFSLRGISKIFKDQKGFYQEYKPIMVSSPFSMLDITGFEKDAYKFIAIDKQGIFIKLKVLHEWAATNIQFYENNIMNREFENPEPLEKYYTFGDDQVFGTGFNSANGFPIAEELVRHPKNKQTREYPTLFWFYDFCKKVLKFTSDFLTEPQPKGKRVKNDNTPALSFIDYLNTNDNQKSLEYLKSQFYGQKGQVIAYMIYALDLSIHALKPYDLANLYKAIIKEFGNVGAYESIRKTKIPNKDINPKQYIKYNAILYNVSTNIQRSIL